MGRKSSSSSQWNAINKCRRNDGDRRITKVNTTVRIVADKNHPRVLKSVGENTTRNRMLA